MTITTTTQEFTVQEKITALKHLVHGHDFAWIGAALGKREEPVRLVGESYGYPDRDKMAWAVDELLKESSAIPVRTSPTARKPTPTRPGPPGRPPVPAEATPRPAAVKSRNGVHAGKTYVAALTVVQLFADRAYQRELDTHRVQRMVDAFDPSLLGIIDVSDRGDGRYAVIDGQHRWAVILKRFGAKAPIVCNVHAGLSVEQEAALFYEIDHSRRNLTGWDRWWARRGAGDSAVLAIERLVERHGLLVEAGTRDGSVRATKALEDVVGLGGLSLLDSTLAVITAAWGRAADALDGTHIHGLALVLHHYDLDGEVDPDRLVAAMQDIAPRQVKARAGQLREAHKGILPRLAAAVLVDRYNAQPGRKVESFFVRLPSHGLTNVKRDMAKRQDDAIRTWARSKGFLGHNKTRITQPLRDAHAAAHVSGVVRDPYVSQEASDLVQDEAI